MLFRSVLLGPEGFRQAEISTEGGHSSAPTTNGTVLVQSTGSSEGVDQATAMHKLVIYETTQR